MNELFFWLLGANVGFCISGMIKNVLGLWGIGFLAAVASVVVKVFYL